MEDFKFTKIIKHSYGNQSFGKMNFTTRRVSTSVMGYALPPGCNLPHASG